jgi:flagellar basal-body rod protein FlgB
MELAVRRVPNPEFAMNTLSDDLLFRRTLLPILDAGLDAYAMRQKAIANNVANAEVDGYQRRVVAFEEELREALEENGGRLARSHPDHLPQPGDSLTPRPRLEIDTDSGYHNGRNNVDIDREMTELARAQLGYRFATRQTRHLVEMLGLAIRGRR